MVESGSVDRKLTYILHNDAGQSFGMVKIWPSSRVAGQMSPAGTVGLIGGQFILGVETLLAAPKLLVDSAGPSDLCAPFDLGGMVI